MPNMEIDNKLKIFIDFDGTITTKDVGEEFFLKFGDNEKTDGIIKRWINEEISSKQMWIELCETLRKISQPEVNKFLELIELDEAFLKFANYCKEHDLDIFIVSDGFDIYINQILKREGLSDLKVFCNILKIDDAGKAIPEFPFTDEECLKCANCKRNHVIENSADDDYTLFIGDGWSDTCAVQYCDYILAKKSLLKFCEKNRISYFPYNNLHNVIRRVEELRKKKRLKKRHQAVIKRKQVYEQG